MFLTSFYKVVGTLVICKVILSVTSVSRSFSSEVRCSPIVNQKNFLLSPPACGKKAVLAGFTCILSCRKGYTLHGNRKAVCQSSGNWTANVHKAVCAGNALCPKKETELFPTGVLRSEVITVWVVNGLFQWRGRCWGQAGRSFILKFLKK